MAHFDEIGEFGLDQVLTKRLTTPGGAVAPTVAPELFPTFTLESDRPEWGYLKGERHSSRYLTVAAVAGQYSMMQLYLPATAREICVVQSIQSANANGWEAARIVGISGGLGGWVAYSTAASDFRYRGDATATILERNNNAAFPTRFPSLAIGAGSGFTVQGPIIITPGTSLCMFSGTVNQVLSLNIRYYERGAQPGELI